MKLNDTMKQQNETMRQQDTEAENATKKWHNDTTNQHNTDTRAGFWHKLYNSQFDSIQYRLFWIYQVHTRYTWESVGTTLLYYWRLKLTDFFGYTTA